MRFIGNKELIVSEIIDLLDKKGLLNKNLTFFDAFCGTGAVSDAVKDSFNLIINDLLNWCVIYSMGRICINDCKFKKLGFNPFEFFNSNNNQTKGFFFKNYSPGGSKRMFFSPENAARIDYFRATIEDWKNKNLISEKEYYFLLASLIESISKVSNTAGVYGAFLKHWDPRATKPIKLSSVGSKKSKYKKLAFYNKKIEEIISDINCDILYLDPPYTQNQYGTQYHLIETLVLNDTPTISKITGSRSTAPMRSDWSKDYKPHILLDKVLSKTKAKYILFSYSTDGFMSKDFIEASFKRYGKPETYICKKISYKKYKNFKSRGPKNHFEYLFFIEKKEDNQVNYESPLNYIGSKAKMILEIKKHLPNEIDIFIDGFGGGFNVGINMDSKNIVYNDLNFLVKSLVESFKIHDTYQYILYIKNIIRKFGLEPSNSDAYIRVRDYYNSLPLSKRDPRLLYTVILYGYNQQIRFNGGYKFNNPVGMRWFNNKVLEKMISFSRIIKEKNVIFKSKDHTELEDYDNQNIFVYMDPPYRLTNGSYNDGKRGFKGWNVEDEENLFDFADKLDSQGKRFMISYVPKHKGKINNQLKDWVKRTGYSLINVKEIQGINRKEVLIVNYK
ncbi:MAG: DNA adenine methylase [Nanoarchaeota archaeon]|nr:DNA adenine methylase [Nanoarchaeota archaeon]